MKDKKLLVSFVATMVAAIFLRLFVIDVISVSNDLLQPDFYPGDFLLISKISKVEEGHWALLRDYPKKSVYSIRKIVEAESEQGFQIVEPSANSGAESKVFVERKQIAGKAIFILWSLPCKPSAVVNGLCPEKGTRFLKPVSPN